ncbi:hypothetical protein [uncultured Litoreibacter sp.]|uniref:hypothetical protein n=1 Tax=uncultured Litoreibacter sp. TaxID=1392394 RepID=UPI002609539C|nr:hypothetical protein [uncultured Litoreibacter sp.]
MTTSTSTQTAVAEIVTFKLKDGVSDADFVAISQQTESWVRSAAGFRARHLSKDEHGVWTDYVIWEDMEKAMRVAREFEKQDFAPAIGGAINPETISIRHSAIQWQMAS